MPPADVAEAGLTLDTLAGGLDTGVAGLVGLDMPAWAVLDTDAGGGLAIVSDAAVDAGRLDTGLDRPAGLDTAPGPGLDIGTGRLDRPPADVAEAGVTLDTLAGGLDTGVAGLVGLDMPARAGLDTDAGGGLDIVSDAAVDAGRLDTGLDKPAGLDTAPGPGLDIGTGRLDMPPADVAGVGVTLDTPAGGLDMGVAGLVGLDMPARAGLDTDAGGGLAIVSDAAVDAGRLDTGLDKPAGWTREP